MKGRDQYPAGVPCFVDLNVPDANAAIDFYRGIFGWKFENRLPPEVPGGYFVAQRDDFDVAGLASALAMPGVWSTYVSVDNVDDTARRVRDAGGTVLIPPSDVDGFGRTLVFVDPTGAQLRCWQAIGFIGAQLVNADGTWNWSDLYTRDVERAAGFYREVFGWVAAPVEFGTFTATMWQRPGYGDFLEQREPGLRDRQAEQGAPAGFADAIGWLNETTDEPRWHVTFASDDTDAVVAATERLGGSVVDAPTSQGVVRTARLRDPQGAVFSVNTFAPN